MKPSDVARFWAKVDKSNGEESCWEWTAYRDKAGYGMFHYGGRAEKKTTRAHRLAYVVVNGPILGGLHVLHRCDNPACVNPSHLKLGTHQDNMVDRREKRRTACGQRSGVHTKPEAFVANRPRGETHGCSKLTAEQVDEIRDLWETGCCTQTSIGRLYGVTQAMVSSIVLRKNWKYP